MASSWKGHLTFGLVSIPIRLYPGARKEGIRLHQVHKKCRTRIRQPLFCPTCNRIVQRSEIIKGYEYEKEQYVLVENEEIKKIAPPSERTMEIQEFVKVAEVDPLYFHASYLAVPEQVGRKAYDLLLKTLEETRRAGIAKASMHDREYLIVIRPRDNGLTLHSMYYAHEIRHVSDYGQQPAAKLKPQEIKLAKQLVESLSAKFEPEKYQDEYQERLKELMDSKRKGQHVTTRPQPKPAPIISITDALKRSLTQRTPKARTQTARRAHRAKRSVQKAA